MTTGFKIIGIPIRTTNQNSQAQQDLTHLWSRFISDNLIETIPNKCSNDIFAIYTDYESDFTGRYTAIIGVTVSSLDKIPSDLIGREFPNAKFQKLTAKGLIPAAVADTWNKIWNNEISLERSYTYDYEVYGSDSQKGNNSEVDIYISIE